MEKSEKRGLRINLIFSLIGALFSGYLSYGTLFSGSCPISEGCSILLGSPVCVYGFVMFSSLLVLSFLSMFKKTKEKHVKMLNKGILLISFIGLLFSGYYSILELFINPSSSYSLLLPSCVYGSFMYIVVFVNTLILIKKSKK